MCKLRAILRQPMQHQKYIQITILVLVFFEVRNTRMRTGASKQHDSQVTVGNGCGRVCGQRRFVAGTSRRGRNCDVAPSGNADFDRSGVLMLSRPVLDVS